MSSLSEQYYLVESERYEETMNTVVLPWLQSRENVRTVQGHEGRPLYTVSYAAEEPMGTVFLVHGFTENALKYAELIWSLLHLHFSVVAYDQRGHGRSWRAEGIPHSSVTHVDRFSEYIQDLRIITETYGKEMPSPLFLFAHSMGGAVASLFLEEYPGVFAAAVLTSPMIAPNIGGVPAGLASALALCASKLGKKKHNPFFMKPYAGPEDFQTSCATDPHRFAWYDQIKAARPEFQNSVPSYQWSYESIHVTERILAPGKPEGISCPVLLFTAEHDSSVLPDPQLRLIERIPGGTQRLIRGARHEIYRSTTDVVAGWWQEIIQFYRIHAGIAPEGGTEH